MFRDQQQGLGSGGFAGIRGSPLIFCSSLKKGPIITDHRAAWEARSVGENHLTGNKVSVTAGAIRSRLSQPGSTSWFLKDTRTGTAEIKKTTYIQMKFNKTHHLDNCTLIPKMKCLPMKQSCTAFSRNVDLFDAPSKLCTNLQQYITYHLSYRNKRNPHCFSLNS